MFTAESSANCDAKEIYDQLNDVTARAASMTGAEGAGLAVRQGGRLVTVASQGSNAPSVGVEVFPNSFAGQCFEQGSILVCDDVADDARVDPVTCRALNIGSMVAAPILASGSRKGVLAVFASQTRAFSRSKVDLIKTMAIVAGELLASDAELMANSPSPSSAPTPDLEHEKPLVTSEAAADQSGQQPKAVESKIHVVKPAPAQKAVPQPATELPPPAPSTTPAAGKEVPAEEKKKTAAPASTAAVAKRNKEDTAVAVAAKKIDVPVSTPPAVRGQDKQSTPPPVKAVDAPAIPAEVSIAPQFTLEQPSSGNRSIILVAIVLIVVAVAGAGVFMLRGRSGKPSNVGVNTAAVAPSMSTAPSTSESAVPAEPDSTKAGSSSNETKPRTVAPAPPSQPASSANNATQVWRQPMLIHAPSGNRSSNQPDVAPPNLQLAPGAAPISLSTKTYVPNAPASAITPALALRKVMPAFPPGSTARGTVMITATIQKDGKVGSVRATSGHPTLRMAAMNAVKQWFYRPALLNGQPAESTVQIKIDFTGGH